MGDNLLTAPLTAIKQLGEQSNQAIQSLGNGVANVASQGLDALITNVPPLPGMGNSGSKSLSLIPGKLTSALAKVEDVVIPKGVNLPKLSQAIKGSTTTVPTATTEVPATPNGTTKVVTTQKGNGEKIFRMRGM